MSDSLKIKLSIADRVYPLTIHPSREEGLRNAAKLIEEMIRKFEQNYAVRDKQDVLAMCALQFAAQVEQEKIDSSLNHSATHERINALNDLIEEQLSETFL